MNTIQSDVYFKKIINFNFFRKSLRFKVSQDLFSSHVIDNGTELLLRSIVNKNFDYVHTILDLGCGYGPIGLTLKKLQPKINIHMTDRDALAVDYTKQNLLLNDLTNVEVYGSLGYDEIRRNDFDLIVSNIPAKAVSSADYTLG